MDAHPTSNTSDAPLRLLIIDDDRELCDLLREYLGSMGFTVETVNDAHEGVRRAVTNRFAVTVLDVMLPGLDGFEALRRIRAQSKTPVLMLTARGDEVDRIVGLEIGADDYLPKPFNPRELVARIRAILRRSNADHATSPSARDSVVIVGDLKLDPGSRTTECSGRLVELTSAEFDLLMILARSAGRVVSREELSQEAFGRRLFPEDRSIDVHISHLRRKLGPLNPTLGGGERIKTLRGSGYLYVVPPDLNVASHTAAHRRSGQVAMKFRSLFVKIFLWFWLSITVVIGSLALVTWLYPYSAVPSGSLPDRLHELQVRGTIAVLELKGKEAFEQHRKQLDSASRLRTYYLDDTGAELSGQSVPERLLSFAREHQEEIDDGERVMVGAPSRLAIPITGANGRKYLALVESHRAGASTQPGGPDRNPGGPMRGGERGPASRPGDSRESLREPERRPPPPPDGERRGAGGPGNPGGLGGGPQRPRGPGGPPPDLTPRFELLVPAHVLVLRLLAVVLVAGIGCFLLARYLTSPVRRLQHAARQLAEGDFAARAGPKLASRRDEIGELGRDFDRMADRIESLLTSQKRLLQDVSHELRSPLARLNVALELAARDAGPAAAPALDRVGLEAQRLNDLIGQLLTLVRLERGSTQPAMSVLDLRALVEDVAADAEFEAAAGNRHVRVVRCDDCRVNGSSSLLRSAIENVMRNAVHYTPQGSEVEVSLTVWHGTMISHDHSRMATLEVRDFGPGVPEDSLTSIFQPFYRVADARDRGSGGTGLGLAIADRAIRLHGGTLEAVNAPLSGGASGLIVRIQIPLASG